MFLLSPGGPGNSKKSGISRSQSQRPVGFKDRAPPRTMASPCKETGDEVTGTISQDPVSDLNTQFEPSGEATTTQNIISAPTAACKDVAPSSGSGAALQTERTCDKEVITQEGADMVPEETPPLPLRRGKEQTPEGGGSESVILSEVTGSRGVEGDSYRLVSSSTVVWFVNTDISSPFSSCFESGRTKGRVTWTETYLWHNDCVFLCSLTPKRLHGFPLCVRLDSQSPGASWKLQSHCVRTRVYLNRKMPFVRISVKESLIIC